MSHFKLKASTKVLDVVPIKKYVSEKTGLTVVIADVEGPLVNGFFSLATEAHDDDGLPHTLEHLIFLGSQRYPYKGILDLLANKCLSQGTNAMTDTHFTAYTIGTVGSEGFLSMLPIYLDHILFPMLTDHGFVTEVHHIDEEGKDAGVVYCEMQGRENTGGSRVRLALLRAMYPNSGYSSETGGLMLNLRDSCNNVKVKDYHKRFYRPENLSVLIVGMVDPEDVFKSLESVENDIVEKRPTLWNDSWSRPWQDIPPPPSSDNRNLEVQWPADVEDCGMINLGWRGTLLWEESGLKDLIGCDILLDYMCSTMVAPLQRDLIEREDALAGSIHTDTEAFLSPLIAIVIDNVPLDKMTEALNQAKLTLSKLRSGEEPLDYERIQRLLKMSLRSYLGFLETAPDYLISQMSCMDILYSRNDKDFERSYNRQMFIKELQKEGPEYWSQLFRKVFHENMITVVGRPSISLQHKMEEDEKHRIEKQKERLGTEGLEQKAKDLEQAMEYNSRDPPSEVLQRVPVPSLKNLRMHDIKTWSNDAGDTCPYMDLSKLPLYARVNSLGTSFVFIHLVIDTSHLTPEKRRFLPLILKTLKNTAVKRGGELISSEKLTGELEEYCMEFSFALGINGSALSVGEYGQHILIGLQCEPVDYEKNISLLYEVLYDSVIDKERLLITSQKIINQATEMRRHARLMLENLLTDFHYEDNTNVHWCSILRQTQFLNNLVERLNSDASEDAVREALEVYKELGNNVWLHVATDLERFKLTEEPWIQFGNSISITKPKITQDKNLMNQTKKRQGYVVGVSGLESNYLKSVWNGPSHQSSDYAPLLVANNYFTQLEGPMWRLIRGAGLSYGYGIGLRDSEVKASFTLYRATNVAAAFEKAESILEEFMSTSKMEESLFCSAKSSTIFDIVNHIKHPQDVCERALQNYFKGVTDDYDKKMITTISELPLQTVSEIAKKWLPERKFANIFIVSHPSRVTQVAESFQKFGLELEAFENVESTYLNN